MGDTATTNTISTYAFPDVFVYYKKRLNTLLSKSSRICTKNISLFHLIKHRENEIE